MSSVVNARNGPSTGALVGARTAFQVHDSDADENRTPDGVISSAPALKPVLSAWTSNSSHFPRQDSRRQQDELKNGKRSNGIVPIYNDEDIPENMYLPDKDDPEGWIHRDKLAKIESEELQAAGINLATARTRSQSKHKSSREALEDVARDPGRVTDPKHDEKRQRLQSPLELDEEDAEQATWDIRSAEEIEAESQAAQYLYSNPVLRKSGSKIPILTSSPAPISVERYERETPIARKRGASGTISFDGDRPAGKVGDPAPNRTLEVSDNPSSAIAPSPNGSPRKQRLISTYNTSSTHRKTSSIGRKTSAPARPAQSPTPRPGTRSGEQDRLRTSANRPEGNPPWLTSMYKPDPMLHPDQQLIPTLAKKQMQAQWAEGNAIPKTYDRDFEPIEVHGPREMQNFSKRSHTPSPINLMAPERQTEDLRPPGLSLPSSRPISGVQSNSGRPGTAGSLTGGYSTMPKVASPAIRENGPNGNMMSPGLPRPMHMAPPTRMQAHNLTMEEDVKVKQGCGCCVVM